MSKVAAVKKSVDFIINNTEGRSDQIMIGLAFSKFLGGDTVALEKEIKRVTSETTDPMVKYEGRRVTHQLNS